MNIQDFKANKDRLLIVDTRERDTFLQGFIPKSIYLPISKMELLPLFHKDETSVVFIADEGKEPEVLRAFESLQMPVKGEILEGGLSAWEQESWGKDLVIDIAADEFAMDYKFDNNLLLIDVRKEEAFADGHIAGAQHIPLSTFGDVLTIANINDEQNVYLHCGGGDSAVVAASLLKREGLHNVRVVIDGYEAMAQQDGVEVVDNSKKKKQS